MIDSIKRLLFEEKEKGSSLIKKANNKHRPNKFYKMLPLWV